LGEVGGAGQERQGGWGFGCGGGELGESWRACGGAGGPEGSSLPALIEVVFRKGLGVGGIEPGGLVEVVEEESLGGLVVFPTVGPHIELGLGWSPGGMGERGEVGSPIWARICVIGSGSVRNAMNVRGIRQVGQIRGKAS